MTGKVSRITLTQDNGDHWLCDVDGTQERAMLWASYANDYPDDMEFMAALVPSRDPCVDWFVKAIAPAGTHVDPLNGVHEGYDPGFHLMAEARMVDRVIVLGDKSKVWYVPKGADIYVEIEE